MRVFSAEGSENIDTVNWKWKQIGQDVFPTWPNYKYRDSSSGSSVSLSDDGKSPAVGDYRNDYVWVYRMDDSRFDWILVGEAIGEGVQVTGEYLGYSVSLSGDGNTVAIGSSRYNSDNWLNTGQVMVFGVE